MKQRILFFLRLRLTVFFLNTTKLIIPFLVTCAHVFLTKVGTQPRVHLHTGTHISNVCVLVSSLNSLLIPAPSRLEGSKLWETANDEVGS